MSDTAAESVDLTPSFPDGGGDVDDDGDGGGGGDGGCVGCVGIGSGCVCCEEFVTVPPVSVSGDAVTESVAGATDVDLPAEIWLVCLACCCL